MKASLSTTDDMPHRVIKGPSVKLVTEPPIGIARGVEEKVTRDTLEGSLKGLSLNIFAASGLSQDSLSDSGLGNALPSGRVDSIIHYLKHRLIKPSTEGVSEREIIAAHRRGFNPCRVGWEVEKLKFRDPHLRGLRDNLKRGEGVGKAECIFEEEEVVVRAPIGARAFGEKAESPSFSFIGLRGRDRELEEEGEDAKDKDAVNASIVLLAKVKGGPFNGARPILSNGRGPNLPKRSQDRLRSRGSGRSQERKRPPKWDRRNG